MTRHPLHSVIALVVLITTVSGAGVVAVFSDTATTGTNDVSSGEQPQLDALQIATAPDAGFACGSFSSDLTTGLFLVDEFQPLDVETAYVCLRNDHSAALNLSVGAIDLVDSELACTNDEATFDASCGTGAGELSRLITVDFTAWDNCTSATSVELTGFERLTTYAASPLALGPLGAGQTACLSVDIGYGIGWGMTSAEQQAAQTDQSTWRFAFAATE